MTNVGRNMAAGPPAPVQGIPMGYSGATVQGTYPGIGTVDLGVPKVGAGGVNPTLQTAQAGQEALAPANGPSQSSARSTNRFYLPRPFSR
jgi:hypothetical protein